MTASTHHADESNDGVRIDTSRAAMQQALNAIEESGCKADLMAAADALRAALAEQKCPCGDRPAEQCPGEWEPGCDLGANAKHAKVAEQAQPVDPWPQIRRDFEQRMMAVGFTPTCLTWLDGGIYASPAVHSEWTLEKLKYTTPLAPVVPPGWHPISEPYEPTDELDIMLSDGSILCAVLPQFDGDLWWGGDGTGEKFIDPKYANVTHWRLHAAPEAPTQPAPQPLTDEQIDAAYSSEPAAVYELMYGHEISVQQFKAAMRVVARAVEAVVLKRMGVQR